MPDFKTLLQYITPQHTLSRVMGKLAHCTRPQWLKNLAIKKFIAHYGVNLSEAIEPDAEQYASFNAFFTRKLLPHARIIDKNPNTVISAADGCISEIGKITGQQLLQAKGYYYDLHTLLGGGSEAAWFQEGAFATIYLSPKDYHRVHMPYAGQFLKQIYVPGKLFSVNHRTQHTVPQLFTRNERIVTLFQTAQGKMAVIFVGAMIVGNIVITAETGHKLEKGDELGYFQLGSTVIILFEATSQLRWNAALGAGSAVKLGQAIGEF